MKKSVLSAAWLFLGILAVAAVLISLGKREDVAEPRLDSYRPSGLSAFGDLLRSNDYRAVATISPLPDLRKNDIAVVFIDEAAPEPFTDESSTIIANLASFMDSGGRVIVLPFSKKFAEDSAGVGPDALVNAVSSKQLKIKTRPLGDFRADNLVPEDSTSIPLWSSPQQHCDFAKLSRVGKGFLMTVQDGYIATNRFIGDEQNADLLMNLVASVAPKGSRIVFTEAGFRENEASLIELLGPGATGAWYQFLFLFVVVIFTLGKRFGLPEESRPPQTGQRELVDAISDTYRRAGSTRVACRAAYDRADQQVRKAVRLSADAPSSERDERVPPALALEFRRVFEASIDDLSAKDAFERCQALSTQVSRFLARPK